MVPEREVLARVEQSNLQARLIGLVVVIAAVAVSLAISRQVARPLERVARETEAIGRLSLAASPVAHSIVREVDRLAVAVEETKTSLRSFGKYVPTDLLRLLVATGQEAELGGERRRMTVSFCDLANFTGLAEGLDPEELVLHIGEYFQRLSADVTGSGGTVDKFIGDAIMAFWGAPVPSTNHATAACLAALRARATMTALRARWALDGKPLLSARIGVQTGEVLVGNIGSPARFNYTVMGDPVNVASRLEGPEQALRDRHPHRRVHPPGRRRDHPRPPRRPGQRQGQAPRPDDLRAPRPPRRGHRRGSPPRRPRRPGPRPLLRPRLGLRHRPLRRDPHDPTRRRTRRRPHRPLPGLPSRAPARRLGRRPSHGEQVVVARSAAS